MERGKGNDDWKKRDRTAYLVDMPPATGGWDVKQAMPEQERWPSSLSGPVTFRYVTLRHVAQGELTN